MPPLPPLRILLVDDNRAFRMFAAAYLSGWSHVSVVGSIGSGEQALEFCGQHAVDLLLMDLSMPGLNGLEATRQLKSRPASPRVVIVTLKEEAEYTELARAAGADGLIRKGEFVTTLLPLLAELFPAATHA